MPEHTSRFSRSFFPSTISIDQAKDTGMAMVLITIIAGLVTGNNHWFMGALVLLVFDMTVPVMYSPVAKLWLGLSLLIGSIVSKILLGLIFYLVVTPLGNLKKMFGSEPLRLRQWRKNTDSVFTNPDHTFTASDIEHPY